MGENGKRRRVMAGKVKPAILVTQNEDFHPVLRGTEDRILGEVSPKEFFGVCVWGGGGGGQSPRDKWGIGEPTIKGEMHRETSRGG